MPISTLRGYPRIGGVIGYGPVGGSAVWKLQERYALADDFYDDVSLLLKMNGANGSTTFLDSSKFGHAVTANGGAAISTTESKFGGSSAAFDGTGDYLTVPDSPQFEFGSGDFTIEGWVYFNETVSTGTQAIIEKRSTGFSAGDWVLFRTGSWPADLRLVSQDYSSDGSTPLLEGSAVLGKSAWHHIAICRSGDDWKMYVDGVLEDSITSATTISDSSLGLTVGRDNASGGRFYLNGYIDSLRITKGEARYTTAFTPPQRDFLP